MAFSFQNGHGNGNGMRGRRFRSTGVLSEMNVIPLVDVVLVLLIIFMLTAHMMEFGLEVEVPKVRQVRDSAEDLPVITISRDSELYLGERTVNINVLGEEVRKRYPGAGAVYVRADKGTTWDPIAQVISALGEQKLDVRVVTQPEDETGRRNR